MTREQDCRGYRRLGIDLKSMLAGVVLTLIGVCVVGAAGGNGTGGRYQIEVLSGQRFVIVDTVSGQIWVREAALQLDYGTVTRPQRPQRMPL